MCAPGRCLAWIVGQGQRTVKGPYGRAPPEALTSFLPRPDLGAPLQAPWRAISDSPGVRPRGRMTDWSASGRVACPARPTAISYAAAQPEREARTLLSRVIGIIVAF